MDFTTWHRDTTSPGSETAQPKDAEYGVSLDPSDSQSVRQTGGHARC